jgi:hypothetical protein
MVMCKMQLQQGDDLVSEWIQSNAEILLFLLQCVQLGLLLLLIKMLMTLLQFVLKD